jgi:hypothetical protein
MAIWPSGQACDWQHNAPALVAALGWASQDGMVTTRRAAHVSSVNFTTGVPFEVLPQARFSFCGKGAALRNAALLHERRSPIEAVVCCGLECFALRGQLARLVVAGGALEDTGARVRVALVVLSEAGINRHARLLVHIEVGNAQDWDVGTSHHAGHLRICTQNWYR